jgi:hypothetical protein
MVKKCSKGIICLDNFKLLLILFIPLFIFYILFTQSHNKAYVKSINHSYHNFNPNHINQGSLPQSGYNSLRPIMHPSISYVSNTNDVLMNPYSPPVQYNSPHTYKQIGYLKSNEYGDKLFPIIAKPVHLRRDKWYYYTIFDNIKLPIYKNGRKCSSEYGCDSLMNGDIIQLENINSNFVVYTYDNNTLVYDPII